jgi:predicted RNase H-like HicB family nuclease
MRQVTDLHLSAFYKHLQSPKFKSFKEPYSADMFCEYIHAALSKATYEIIEDEEPFYGEIPELRGVWAIGKTLEECRENLKAVVEGWIALRLRLGLAIPPVGGHTIETPSRVEAVV